MKKNYKWKFSVIIPIYNVEDYLEDTILSIINQTLDFKENIEIILVNDGSPDSSEEICLKYKEMYPNNITYIKKKNGGVSSARNEGIKYATGEIVNFLDSDDKWQITTFENVYNFFKEHKDINIVACKMEYFEAKTGTKHPLNGKFNAGNRVIDLNENPDYIQMHAASCFIKKEAIFNSFSTKLKFAEDSLFITELIMLNKKYGVLGDVHYMYRKRLNESSALDGCGLKKSYYLETINNFHKVLIKKYLKNDSLDKYVQFVLMYDLSWRFKTKIINTTLNKEEKDEYINNIKELLNYIDDDVILNRKNVVLEFKIAILNLKYNYDIISKSQIIDNCFIFNNMRIYNVINKYMLKINVINIKDNYVDIAGQFNIPFDNKNCSLLLKLNDEYYNIELLKSNKQERYFLGEKFLEVKIFRNKFKLNKKLTEIEFYFKYKNNELIKITPSFTSNSKLSENLNTCTLLSNKMVYLKDYSIIVEDYNKDKYFKIEKKYQKYLKTIKKYKIVLFRKIYHLINKFKKKQIWLISDRTNVANDNGMHFFKYVCKKNDENIKPYFIINKSSKDYNEMKKYGKVVNYNSFKYKILFLLSDKIISSQADLWVLNAFGNNEEYYRDLYTYDFIFLQHGITKDDISSWLNALDKNISLFVTSSKREYESIINNKNYLYDESVVKLTGMPRYDNLVNKKEKLIAIMPTWRNNLSGFSQINEGSRLYNSEFKNSEYFNFYNKLINDEKLLEVMKKNGYKGIFVIHPSHINNAIDYKSNDYITVISNFANYQDIFKRASLLITDYSSVAFDFAYLNKPVIYSQFDQSEFYKNHIYKKSYFDYEKDGFGCVKYNYDDTVNEIIKTIENKFLLEEKYQKRINSFYQYHDQKNCERLYSLLIKK